MDKVIGVGHGRCRNRYHSASKQGIGVRSSNDALLFLTFISDSEDVYSKTYVSDWYKAIVKAKHGDPRAVIILLVTPQYSPEEIPGCTTAGDHKNKLRDLINMFPYHVEGDTCVASYAPYFKDAAELVGEACAAIVPQ